MTGVPRFDPAKPFEIETPKFDPSKPYVVEGGQGAPGFVDGLVRKFAAGATMGWADEAAAGLDALTQPVLGRGSEAPTIGARYDENVAKERAKDTSFDRQFPVTSGVAELGGNVAGAVATIPLLPATAATLPGRIAQGAAVGGGFGSAAGAGAAESGAGPTVEGATTGGLVGSAVGGAFPALGKGIVWSYGKLKNLLGLGDAGESAAHQVLRAFERDKISPEDAMLKLQQWHAAGAKPETLADLGGENVKALAATAANIPSQSRQAAMSIVDQRKGGAGERVAGDVAKAISPSVNYSGTVDELMAARQRTAQPLYDKAYETTAWSPRLQEFLADPVMKDGLKRGVNMLRLEAVAEGKPFNPSSLGIDLDEAGNVALRDVPNMRVLDAAKRGLDDILEKYRDGTTGRLSLTPEGKAIDGFRRSYLTTLDDLNPDYKVARAAWAGPTQSKEAMVLGRSILGDDVDVTAKKIAAMDPGDKEFFRAGVAKAIQDKVENTADGRNVVASFFNKPGLRKRLEAAFDTPEQFKAFEAAMKREADMASTNNMISPRAGSHTQRLRAGMDDMGDDVPTGAITSLLHGRPVTAATQMGAALMRRSQGMNSDVADAMAPLLFETDPTKNLWTMQGMTARQKALADEARNSTRDPMIRALSGQVVPGNFGGYVGNRQQ